MNSVSRNEVVGNFGQNRQFGFSLVEVLISLIIMSVGMLGIAGLYVTSMQAGRVSLFRHHAVTLAGDVADRIRANPTAGIAYEDPVDPNVTHDCVDGTTNCTAVEMAANDVFLWQAQAGEALPSGSVAVDFTAAAGTTPPTYQIAVTWSEPGQTPTPSYVITIPVIGI